MVISHSYVSLPEGTGEWLQVLDLLTPQEMDIYKFAVQTRKNFECFRPHLFVI